MRGIGLSAARKCGDPGNRRQRRRDVVDTQHAVALDRFGAFDRRRRVGSRRVGRRIEQPGCRKAGDRDVAAGRPRIIGKDIGRGIGARAAVVLPDLAQAAADADVFRSVDIDLRVLVGCDVVAAVPVENGIRDRHAGDAAQSQAGIVIAIEQAVGNAVGFGSTVTFDSETLIPLEPAVDDRIGVGACTEIDAIAGIVGEIGIQDE